MSIAYVALFLGYKKRKLLVCFTTYNFKANLAELDMLDEKPSSLVWRVPVDQYYTFGSTVKRSYAFYNGTVRNYFNECDNNKWL
jgi:hypothetical protein